MPKIKKERKKKYVVKMLELQELKRVGLEKLQVLDPKQVLVLTRQMGASQRGSKTA